MGCQMPDKRSTQLLKALYNDGKMSRTGIDKLAGYQENELNLVAYELSRCGFIEHVPGETFADDQGELVEAEGYYRITIHGRAYIEQKRNAALNFWVPYIITTLIALISLFR